MNSLGVQEIDQESTSNDGAIGGSTAELANIVAANGIIYNSKHHYAAAVSTIHSSTLRIANLQCIKAGGVLTSITNPKSNTVGTSKSDTCQIGSF